MNFTHIPSKRFAHIPDYRINTPTYPFVLDELTLRGATGIAVAFSFRLLSITYTGPCCIVRRDSDDTEETIYFRNGYVDWRAILAFGDTASVYVKTWYDQSGNGRDATTTTLASQPRIVNAGVLNVDSMGHVFMSNSSSGGGSLVTASYTHTTGYTGFGLFSKLGTSSNTDYFRVLMHSNAGTIGYALEFRGFWSILAAGINWYATTIPGTIGFDKALFEISKSTTASSTPVVYYDTSGLSGLGNSTYNGGTSGFHVVSAAATSPTFRIYESVDGPASLINYRSTYNQNLYDFYSQAPSPYL